MSRFHKLSQTIWHCQYHIVWVPKYRFRILIGEMVLEVDNCIRSFSEKQDSEIIELNVRVDHVHLLAMVPPKKSISDYVGTIKGRTAIRVLNKYKHLKKKPYWGNHFWSRGCYIDTVGLDLEMIRKYVKYQEAQEHRAENRNYFKYQGTTYPCPLRGQGKLSPSRGDQYQPLRGRIFIHFSFSC